MKSGSVTFIDSFIDSHYTANHNFKFCCECRNPDRCSIKRGTPGISELVEERKRVFDALDYRMQYEKLYARLHLRVTAARSKEEKSTTIALPSNDGDNTNEKEGKQQAEKLPEKGKLSYQQAQDHIEQINFVLEDPLERRAENVFERIFFLGPTTTVSATCNDNYDRMNMAMLVRFQMTKQRIRKEFKQYDHTFASCHDGRLPTKAEKEIIRYLYDRYKLVKRKIQELEESLNLLTSNPVVTEENKAASDTNEKGGGFSPALTLPKEEDDLVADDDAKQLVSNDHDVDGGGGDCRDDGIDVSDEGSWCLV